MAGATTIDLVCIGNIALIFAHNAVSPVGRELPLECAHNLRVAVEAHIPAPDARTRQRRRSLFLTRTLFLAVERKINRKTGDELTVFGGMSCSMAPRMLLLDEDLESLTFRTADSEDVIQSLLTERKTDA